MRTAHFFLSVFLLGAIAAPLRTLGQSSDSLSVTLAAPDTVYRLGEITVTATRTATARAQTSQRVTILSADDMRVSGSADVADLLEARSGFFIRRYGQGLATLSLRGAGPSQTLLLVDGLRLSDPQLGQFDVSLLPTFAFRSAEIVHGPTAALYGTDGMAATLNLRRARPEADRIQLLTELGAFGERRVSGGWSGEGGAVSALIAAEYRSADGDFPYLNEALFPARTIRRRNADREQRSLFATVDADVGPHALTAALLYAGGQQGLPGVAGSPPQGERRWDQHLRVWIRDDLPVPAGRLRMQAFAHRGQLRYAHPGRSIDDTGRTLTSGAEATLHSPVAREWLVVTGAAGGFARARHPSLASAAREMHGSVYVSGSGRYDRWRLYPALRLDLYSQSRQSPRAAVSPRFGANVAPFASLPVYLKANAGTAFRMPTFNDRFWQPGGNPDLQPERSTSVEAGVYLDDRRIAAEVTAFSSRTMDQIVWMNRNGDIWSPENLARTRSRGVEASADVSLSRMLRTGLIYSFTKAVDRSDPASGTYDRQLRYVPRHQAKGYLSAVRGSLHLALHARFLGRRYVTGDESESLSPLAVVDVRAGVEQAVGSFYATLSILAENVLDARYAVIQGYPMPPRHGRIQLLLQTR